MSLKKLRQLTIEYCHNSDRLPPLGKLPFQESLCILDMRKLKRVSNEFLGIENDGTSSSVIAFPRLKSLTFRALLEWEKWDYQITKRAEEDLTIIMPCLRSLKIASCH